MAGFDGWFAVSNLPTTSLFLLINVFAESLDTSVEMFLWTRERLARKITLDLEGFDSIAGCNYKLVHNKCEFKEMVVHLAANKRVPQIVNF